MSLKVAVAGETFRAGVARVINYFVSLADHVVGAVPFRAASSLITVTVSIAGVVAVEEVGAFTPRATPRVAFEIVVTGVLCNFLPVQALRWVDAGVVRAAESRVDAVIVEVAEDFLDDRDQGRLPLVVQ